MCRTSVVFFFLPVCAILLVKCAAPDSHAESEARTTTSSVPPTEVSVAVATVRPFEYLIHTSGKVQSANDVKVNFTRPGIIHELRITNGQRVRKGELLAVLHNELQKLTVTKAKLSVDEKEITFGDLMLSYRSMEDTSVYNTIARNIMISSGLATARITYQESKLEYENSFVKAPISGIVSGLGTVVGATVDNNPFLCFIHDPDNLLVVAEVLESDAIRLNPGVLAEVKAADGSDELFVAQVENIDPRVNLKTGLVKVSLRLKESPSLFPGMNARVTLRLPSEKHIIVPREAIVIRSGKPVVFTTQQHRATWNYVRVGRENGNEIEILEGISPGDSVIIENNLQLAHDAPVRIVADDQP